MVKGSRVMVPFCDSCLFSMTFQSSQLTKGIKAALNSFLDNVVIDGYTDVWVDEIRITVYPLDPCRMLSSSWTPLNKSFINSIEAGMACQLSRVTYRCGNGVIPLHHYNPEIVCKPLPVLDDSSHTTSSSTKSLPEDTSWLLTEETGGLTKSEDLAKTAGSHEGRSSTSTDVACQDPRTIQESDGKEPAPKRRPVIDELDLTHGTEHAVGGVSATSESSLCPLFILPEHLGEVSLKVPLSSLPLEQQATVSARCSKLALELLSDCKCLVSFWSSGRRSEEVYDRQLLAMLRQCFHDIVKSYESRVKEVVGELIGEDMLAG